MTQEGASASVGWDGVRYDRVADPQHRWGKAVLEHLDLQGTELVLDAGCGSGRVTEDLLDRLPGGRVVALDASASMLEQARGRLSSFGERVRFVEADLLDLTPDLLGSDQPVDAVFSTATFHWVKDHDALFRNLAAVLRRGGQLVAQCGAAGNVERVIRSARAAGMELEDSWNFASPDDTIKRLEHSGFTAIRVWTHAEPTAFPDAETLIEFLETACLGEHLAGLPAPERRDLAGRIATRMDEPVIDYQRLNIVARRSEL